MIRTRGQPSCYRPLILLSENAIIPLAIRVGSHHLLRQLYRFYLSSFSAYVANPFRQDTRSWHQHDYLSARALSRLRQCIKAVESGKEQQWLMPSRFADYQAGKPITVVVVFTNSCSAASTHIAHVCWLRSPLFFMPSN